MTKLLAILSLAIVVLFSLAACGEEAEHTPAPVSPAAAAHASSDEVMTLPSSVTGSTPAATPAPRVSESNRETQLVNDLRGDHSDALVVAPAPTAMPPATSAPQTTSMPATVANMIVETAGEAAAMKSESTPAPAANSASAYQPSGTPAPASAPQALGTPSATTFRDYLRERFVSTANDAVSTFSLDTDRTSYYLALNWARQGFEIDPDSVRVEEWINAFDYGYQPPLRNDSFAISSDVFRHPLDSRMHMARIAFQAPDTSFDSTPINVTLVLDASGSMDQGNRVDIAREAAETIRQSLRSQDRIAVVQFSTNVLNEFTVEHRSPDDSAVVRSISRLTPSSSTNVQAGLNKGVQLADRARSANPDAYNYIILMSDGVANVDATNPFAILESAYDPNLGNPLRLITIGVGIENYNDYLLEQLAQHGNGWYRYLTDTSQARATFNRENWLALSIPFADQTRAQVTWNPDVVETWRIVGYENRITSDESFAQARREFAEIPAGAATTVFYELQLKNAVPGGMSRLGDVELRWVTPSTGESNRQHSSIFSQGDLQFATLNDPLLRLGALVALSSDRYSSLPYADAYGPPVHEDLLYLREQLWSLDSRLSDLAAYQDVAFLMDHISKTSQESLRPSGYSR